MERGEPHLKDTYTHKRGHTLFMKTLYSERRHVNYERTDVLLIVSKYVSTSRFTPAKQRALHGMHAFYL